MGARVARQIASLCIACLAVLAWAAPLGAGPAPVSGDPDWLLADWYALKARLAERHGLTIGLAYTALYQKAGDSAFQPRRSRAAGYPIYGYDEAAGGDAEIFGALTLWGGGSGHRAELKFKGEARHRLGTAVAPESLYREIGSAWFTGTGYSEFDPTIVELWLGQSFAGDALELHLGKVFPLTQYDDFPFDNFRTDFIDGPESFHPSIALPNYGLGANATLRPARDLYLRAGIGDANGEPERSGFETFFGEHEYFTLIEGGFDPGGPNATGAKGDVHLSLWHADKRERAGRPGGWGLIASAFEHFGRVAPFLRYGYSEGERGGPAQLEHLVTAGVVLDHIPGRPLDRIGVALSWGQPADALLDDQGSGEVFYRIQMTRELALTYSTQLVVNPALNPEDEAILVSGVRGRLEF